ncbi:hypothetical protein ACWA5Z_05305 [Testudinibacter sp. P80/BLE/0925]|uniref:hypothetical protein n=1 Tax=Testudinibacter sp. TW-1 TaxID=3417757 RepID=UPI003D35AB8B
MYLFLIKKTKQFFHWLGWGYSIFFFLTISTASYFSLPILILNDYKINHLYYFDISATVSKQEINGKLNNHLTLRRVSNKCYKPYCGLPKEGEYKLSKIAFININGMSYIHFICINSDVCFYNISESFIQMKKYTAHKNAKTIFWGVILVNIVMIIEFFTKDYWRKRKNSKL